MTEEIIQLKEVSKKFFMPHFTGTGIRKILNGSLLKKEFHALDGLSFSIKKGGHTAIIGKNGAGKTVLLKIIAGIISPSSGSVTVKKNVSPLISNNVAFHPQFTLRENIYLYAAFLGVEKSRIKKYFEDIVNFAELEKFVEVKHRHLSEGMKIRLGFSIILLLKPEILIFDDVFSLSDQSFLEKVYKKMEELQKNDATMLITSHSEDVLRRFCTEGIVISNGKLSFTGKVDKAIDYYKTQG